MKKDVVKRNAFAEYIGYWDNDDRHGYGRFIDHIHGIRQEGLWERGEFVQNKRYIKSYDPENDYFA